MRIRTLAVGLLVGGLALTACGKEGTPTATTPGGNAATLPTYTVAQNVVVELSYRQPAPPSSDPKQKPASISKSVYMGWTGMQSQAKLAPIVGRDGIAGGRGSSGRQEQEVSVVEVDATFGRLLGLSEGMKV